MLQPFKGNNFFGETVGNVGYAVYSYGYHFPMAFYNGVQWFINEETYTRSTGRHRGYVRQAVQGETVNMQWLKKLICEAQG